MEDLSCSRCLFRNPVKYDSGCGWLRRVEGRTCKERNEKQVPGMEGYWVLHIEIATNYIRSSIGEDRE